MNYAILYRTLLLHSEPYRKKPTYFLSSNIKRPVSLWHVISCHALFINADRHLHQGTVTTFRAKYSLHLSRYSNKLQQ